MILPVRICGDPILSKRSRKISKIDNRIRELASDMIETMARFEGIGLAANQVGVDLRIISVDPKPAGFDTEPFVIINPEIVKSEGEQEEEEGCLSIPGYVFRVSRPMKIKVKGIDIEGSEFVIQGEGLLTRVLMHEIDHINGILIKDHANSKEI